MPPPIQRKHATKVIVNLEVREVVKRLADGVDYLFWTFGGDVRAATALIVSATMVRAFTDFIPACITGLNWAAGLWMLAAVIWGWSVLPKVRLPDLPSESSSGSQPARMPLTPP